MSTENKFPEVGNDDSDLDDFGDLEVIDDLKNLEGIDMDLEPVFNQKMPSRIEVDFPHLLAAFLLVIAAIWIINAAIRGFWIGPRGP